jgi:hypothetical protein
MAESLIADLLKTPGQVREEQLKKMREEGQVSAARMLTGSGGSPISGVINKLAAQGMQDIPEVMNQSVRSGLLGLGDIAGGLGAQGAKEALQRGALSPEEQQAAEIQKAAVGVSGSPEKMRLFADKLRNMGRADLAQKMEEKASDLELKLRETKVKEREVSIKEGELGVEASKLSLDRQRSQAEVMLGLTSGAIANASAESVSAAMNALDAGKTQSEARKLIKDKQTGKTVVTINQKQEGEFAKTLGEQQAKQYSASADQVDSANRSMSNLNTMEGLLDKGIYTGKLANLFLEGGKILNLVGAGDKETIENTEAYIRTAGREVLTIMSSGALGAGTGLSDADRKFAEGIANGDITLEESSLRRLISITRRVNVMTVKNHNAKVDEYNKRYPTAQLSKRYYIGQEANWDGTTWRYDGEGWVKKGTQ